MSKYAFVAFLAFHVGAALNHLPSTTDARSPVRRLLPRSPSPPPVHDRLSATKKAKAREVFICRGVGDMHESDFKAMGGAWDRYAAENIITGTSPLLYRIMPDGKFDSYGKDFEEWSHKYLSPNGMKLVPHVFCDSTCCDTCQLPQALENAMARRKEFFAESVGAALKYGWDGYAMDFEGGMPDRAEASQFFLEWKAELAKHRGRSGQPLEMHMWSPSGLDEDGISPTMDAMVTMGTYNYGSYSSLLEMGTNATSSWRRQRASMLSQTGSLDSICPAGLRRAQPHHSLLEGGEQVSREARVKGLERGIAAWCGDVQGNSGECGIGLITYDLANARLRCEDIVNVAKGGQEKGMRSIWLWAGGIIPQQWEHGLRYFATSSSPTAAEENVCNTQFSAVGMPSEECGCSFDGNYCCDGKSRHR